VFGQNCLPDQSFQATQLLGYDDHYGLQKHRILHDFVLNFPADLRSMHDAHAS
tara:strand:- start:2196 stop:2354 length:159 start_codon:yes stop_codon:yes gene_type:complete